MEPAIRAMSRREPALTPQNGGLIEEAAVRLCGRRYAGARRLRPLPLELRGDEDYEIETIVEEPATRAASRKEPEGG